MQFSNRLTEVNNYFENKDFHLGYRRLLDAAIETNDFDVYASTLSFSDWYDNAAEQDAAIIQQRVKELLEVISRSNKKPSRSPGDLKLRASNLSKKYRKGNFNLRPLNVDLHNSEIIGLVGENGNGKTTLLRLLSGELEPDTGAVQYSFTGANRSRYHVKSELSFIPQRPLTWYGSLRDNLQFAAVFSGLKGRENHLWTEMIMARMGLRPFRNYTWSRISSGYKMRFELARALVKKPEVLLLDEPLANLDMLAQQIILEDLRFLAHSELMPLSIILSSQQLYEVEKVSDSVVFLQKGQATIQKKGIVNNDEAFQLVIELESTETRERIRALLETHGLQKISFNGGVYILYFGSNTTLGAVLQKIGEAAMPVKYLRDISASSRRYFDA
jgi:ABC-2 type transport system ATP-binding protein